MHLSFYFEIHTERNYVFVPNSRQIVPYSRLSRVSNLDLVLVMTGSTENGCSRKISARVEIVYFVTIYQNRKIM